MQIKLKWAISSFELKYIYANLKQDKHYYQQASLIYALVELSMDMIN